MPCACWKSTQSRILCAAGAVFALVACSPVAAVTPEYPPSQSGGGGGSGSPSGGAHGARDASINLATSEAGPPPADAPPPAPVPVQQNIATMRIDPEDKVIVLERGQGTTVSFRAFATMEGSTTEVEITDRTVFFVPDNYLVGKFPDDGSSLFTTYLPAPPTDPNNPPAPQRGGKVTIQAKAANTQNPVTTVTTTLTVTIIDSGQPADGSPAATPAIPSDPGTAFTGTDSATLAPTLVYPNDQVLLPPNMQQIEVHFLPAKTATLYEISLLSTFSEYRYYARCYADPKKFLAGSCAFEFDADTVNIIAESNRGTDPVTLMVRGTDENGNVGSSASIKVQFAAGRVDGAIYYWTTSDPPRIMRFDFSSQSALSTAIQPSDLPSDSGTPGGNTRCVGCHALSRDGSRMLASTGDSGVGNLVYISDLSKPKTAADWLTVDGRNTGVASQNRILTASFNKDGSQFVAVAPANDGSLGVNKLAFHDGVTGIRQSALDVGFPVSFPDWSPDDQTIAVTHIYGGNSSTIQFQEGGISVIRRSATGWTTLAEEIVPHTVGKSRYTPSFVPDSSLLLYSEATRQTGDWDALLDAYSDPSATVWAVKPAAKATPVLLARANAVSVADKLTLVDGRDPIVVKRIASGQLMNTYPKAAPFVSTQGGHTLFWFTVASQRRAGLRLYKANNSVVGDTATQVLLWMFAVDADKVLAGDDGSYPGFFLPFQDMLTANHMGVWTQKYVSDTPPKEPPVPPFTPTAPPTTVEPPPVPIL